MPTTTLFSPLNMTNQLLRDDVENTHLPSSYLSPRMSSDGSSECERELLMSLFESSGSENEHVSSPTKSSSDLSYSFNNDLGRGGRPYPYTRSKTRWRKRPNDELKYLRSQIVKLEGLVAHLNRSDYSSKVVTCTEEDRDNQAQALCKLNKESRKTKMEESLAENRMLQAMVISQFHVAKALQTALDESMRLRARKVCWPSSSAASDELIFALLDEEKELQYAATDKVMDESGISQMYHPYFADIVFHKDKNGVSFQHNDVRVLPFPVANVASALRYSLKHGCARVGPTQHCRKFIMSDRYSQAVTVDNVDVPGTLPVEVKGRHFLWSVAKPDRTVIAWSSFNEYNGYKNIRLLKRLWFLIEPTKLETSLGTSQGCILRTIVRFTPVDPEVDISHIEEMSDVVMCAYKRDSVRVVLAVRAQLAALVAKS